MSERTPQDVLREPRTETGRLFVSGSLSERIIRFGKNFPTSEIICIIEDEAAALDKAIAEAPDSPPNPCAQALDELARQDAVIDRLNAALRVASHQPHDQLGEPNEGFPVCSVCGAIQTAPDSPPETMLDLLNRKRDNPYSEGSGKEERWAGWVEGFDAARNIVRAADTLSEKPGLPELTSYDRLEEVIRVELDRDGKHDWDETARLAKALAPRIWNELHAFPLESGSTDSEGRS